jgi:hypothetical protein
MKTHDFYATPGGGAWRRALASIAATGAVAALAACQANVTHEDPTGTVLGRVRAPATEHSPVLVLAVDRGTGRVAHRAFLGRGTAFALPLHPGRYKFHACADANADGRCNADEALSATYSLTNEVRAGDVIQMPTITLEPREQIAR